MDKAMREYAVDFIVPTHAFLTEWLRRRAIAALQGELTAMGYPATRRISFERVECWPCSIRIKVTVRYGNNQ